jgi:hypothetical protein
MPKVLKKNPRLCFHFILVDHNFNTLPDIKRTHNVEVRNRAQPGQPYEQPWFEKATTVKADSHIPCRSPAVLKTDSHIPCRSLAATLPLPSHSPRVHCFTLATASEIGMLLITNFLELGVASHQHAVTLPPRPCHGLERSLSERHIRGMAG